MYTRSLKALIDELHRLPGVGPKSAQRLAFHLLKVPEEEALALAEAIVAVKRQTASCPRCFNVAPRGELCEYCADEGRDAEVLCVVEEAPDVVALERTRLFHGRYHVLQGALNPLQGVGPGELRVSELLARVREEKVREVIVSTNPTLEGEATAGLLAKELAPFDVTLTRIVVGLPMGSDIEYADEISLGRALLDRRRLEAS